MEGMMECKDCKHPMGKNGHRWSGRHWVQMYKCSKCGWIAQEKKEEKPV